jgi:hypothetical protein
MKRHMKSYLLVLGITALLLSVTLPLSAEDESQESGSLIVEVKEADTGKPIYQARLTLSFREPGDPVKLKRPKRISYSAKTNAQGRYKFLDIPKGTVLLMVTSPHRQSYGKELEFQKDNQVFEVKLRKPQPVI